MLASRKLTFMVSLDFYFCIFAWSDIFCVALMYGVQQPTGPLIWLSIPLVAHVKGAGVEVE